VPLLRQANVSCLAELTQLQENLAQIFEAPSCGDIRYITTP